MRNNFHDLLIIAVLAVFVYGVRMDGAVRR